MSKAPQSSTADRPAAAARLTPMMRQYRAAKAEHPDAIVLFRMGDFYEMFDEDAVLCSRLLGITLTSRDKKSGQPMAGVPWHAAETYVARLVRQGYRVAICEQVEDAKLAKGLVERKVTELITPGTAIQAGLVIENDNTFVLALKPAGTVWGAALADASTGEFMAGEFDRAALVEEMGHRPVAEILVPEAVTPPAEITERGEGAAPIMVTARPPWGFEPSHARERLCKHFGTVSLDPFDAGDLNEGLGAAAALLDYLAEMRGSEARHVTRLQRLGPRTAMTLDQATLEHLDVVPQRGAAPAGTLYGVLDTTRTPMGARLLRAWLARPTLDLEEIHRRQRAVTALAEDDGRRARLRAALGRLGDLDRLAGRLEAGKGGARELRAIAEALRQVPELAGALPDGGGGPAGTAVPAAPVLLASIGADLDPQPDVRDRILREIVDQPPLSVTEGGIFRDGVDPELDEVRAAARSGKAWISELEAEERRRTGIPKLKVGFNRVFGYYIEVSRAHLGSVPGDYTRKQTLVGGERFITPALKEMESKILGAEERIARIEHRLFLALRDRVIADIGRLLRTARAAQLLDVLQSLAESARTRGYVCPEVVEDGVLEIDGGRHPVVESSLVNEGFVPNDTRVGGDGAHVLIITGPNMAGKSTYLRQVGLITLLAHIGSYVPAGRARVPLTDRVFTRVGAADRITRGQSTFLVEMNETAVILHHATERSLVLLDEIGRGTSTYDGLAIAWAVAEHLHGRQPAAPRTLFATHYHELTVLADELPGVANLNVAVDESGDTVTFLHRIVPGAAGRSYGIHVAELAGLPHPVIRRARAVLERLERGEGVGGEHGAVQLGLFGWPPAAGGEPASGEAAAGGAAPGRKDGAAALSEAERGVLAELRRVSVEEVPPIEALRMLDRWRRRLEAGEQAVEAGEGGGQDDRTGQR